MYFPPSHTRPLCDVQQVLLTPPSATLPQETRVEMEMQCVTNGIDFLRGSLDPACQVC